MSMTIIEGPIIRTSLRVMKKTALCLVFVVWLVKLSEIFKVKSAADLQGRRRQRELAGRRTRTCFDGLDKPSRSSVEIKSWSDCVGDTTM